MKADILNVHDTQAHAIRGTGKHPGWGNISQETDWADEPYLFTMGGPIDAPETMPAGGIAAHVMKNFCGDKWNVPVQLLTARA